MNNNNNNNNNKNSSRLCVKNLPGYLGEDRLRELFSRKGAAVTDARIIRAPNGKSRRFGFVGFRSPQDAKDALAFFHNTFIDTSRIVVEPAYAPGSATEHRPWSKYSHGSTRHKSLHPDKYDDYNKREEKVKRKDQKKKKQQLQRGKEGQEEEEGRSKDGNKDESEFEEFLSVVKGRSKNKFWANDDDAQQARARKEQMQLSDDDDDDDEYFDNPSLDDDAAGDDDDNDADEKKMKDKKKKDKKKKKKDKKKKKKDKKTKNEEEDDVDDMDFLRKKSEAYRSDSEEDDSGSDNDDDDDDGNASEAEQEQVKQTNDEPVSIADTGRLYVRNLPFDATEEDLEELFGQFGKVVDVHVARDDTKRSKGYAFVLFMFPEHAVQACAELDGTPFQGRLLHILPARAAPKTGAAAVLDEMDDDTRGSLTYKKRKELERQADADKSESWNTLFIRSDTVADAIAERYSVKKRDILDKDAGNMAVRMALAETQLISETKKFLEDNGVSLDFLKRKKRADTKRSRNVILVKNIPYSTVEDELRRLFAQHGNVGRVLLPPTKTVAVVEFLESSDAKKAFRRLAYTKFKHVPLYLEWAPKKFFTKTAAEISKEQAKANEQVASEAAERGATTIFIKNLNFDTDEATLVKTFRKAGKVVEATVARKKNMKFGKGGRDSHKKMLSMGYGFVQFETAAGAAKALRTMQGVDVDGYKLSLKISTRETQPKTAASASESDSSNDTKKRKRVSDSSNEAKSTKIIVKNVPFQATPKELRELFGTFGQIKALRLPRKFDGQHRGFAFVEFVTKQETMNAFETLSHTHLYGRRLVIDWAKADDSLDDIRAKAAAAVARESDVAAQAASISVDADGVAVHRSKRVKLNSSGNSSSKKNKKSSGHGDVDDSSQSFAKLMNAQSSSSSSSS